LSRPQVAATLDVNSNGNPPQTLRLVQQLSIETFQEGGRLLGCEYALGGRRDNARLRGPIVPMQRFPRCGGRDPDPVLSTVLVAGAHHASPFGDEGPRK
jgi:hypothetical protein